MKYFGQPSLHIIDYDRQCKLMFVFDDNGIYETQDEKMIQWIAKNKNFIRNEESVKIDLTKSDEEIIPSEEISLEDMSEDQLRELAKGNKIKNWHNKKPENLIIELRGLSNG